MRDLFIDLDGVLADFDRFYAEQFGVVLDRLAPEPPGMWEPVAAHGSFFACLPVTSDGHELWGGVCALHPRPVILTGIPEDRHAIVSAEANKRAWVARHFGADVPVICCRSKDKRLHGKPGDILIDDWHKYRHLWEEMGGIFVLHTSASVSLREARELLT